MADSDFVGRIIVGHSTGSRYRVSEINKDAHGDTVYTAEGIDIDVGVRVNLDYITDDTTQHEWENQTGGNA